jgi:hypothetical protein
MSQPRELFGINVPTWMRKSLKRWKKIFNLNDWVIKVQFSSSSTLSNEGEDVVAHTLTDSRYKISTITVSEKLLEDNEVNRGSFFHEMRHIVYASYLTEMLERDVINRYVPESERKAVTRQMDDAIESLIENDVYVFEQLTQL